MQCLERTKGMEMELKFPSIAKGDIKKVALIVVALTLTVLFLHIWLIVDTVLINKETFNTLAVELAITELDINNSPGLKQDDESLLEIVREQFLKPPPLKTTPYNFSSYFRDSKTCSPSYQQAVINAIDFNPSCGQVQVLEDILRGLTPGFFLDCGANDGIFVSNTFWLERKLGWTGLLVEADPNAFATLASLNRKSWLSNTCFSVTPAPKKMTFFVNPNYSEASGLIKSAYYGAVKGVGIQCLPLYTVLMAINRTVIDFFTLDVEGNELEILKTVPFDKIVFKVLSIEHLFIPGGKKVLRKFMESKGYFFYRTIVQDGSGDSVFLHPSVKLNEQQLKQVGHHDAEKKVGSRVWARKGKRG